MRALSRIVAGIVMIVGTLVLARVVFHEHQVHAATIIGWTWAVAGGIFCVGFLFPRESDESVSSFVLPAVGAALLLPLTIHMPIALAYYGSDAFDTWCMLSVIFVGPAHVVFAAMVGRRAAAIARGQQAQEVRNIYGVTVAISGVPGLLVVLPVFITAATALPLWPLLHRMTRWCQPFGVPRAIARTAGA